MRWEGKQEPRFGGGENGYGGGWDSGTSSYGGAVSYGGYGSGTAGGAVRAYRETVSRAASQRPAAKGGGASPMLELQTGDGVRAGNSAGCSVHVRRCYGHRPIPGDGEAQAADAEICRKPYEEAVNAESAPRRGALSLLENNFYSQNPGHQGCLAGVDFGAFQFGAGL